jgi:hypothetical protein
VLGSRYGSLPRSRGGCSRARAAIGVRRRAWTLAADPAATRTRPDRAIYLGTSRLDIKSISLRLSRDLGSARTGSETASYRFSFAGRVARRLARRDDPCGAEQHSRAMTAKVLVWAKSGASRTRSRHYCSAADRNLNATTGRRRCIRTPRRRNERRARASPTSKRANQHSPLGAPACAFAALGACGAAGGFA